MGTDDLHKRKSIKRDQKKIKKEKKSVLIACEDEKSSKYYLQSLIKDKKLTGKVIIAEHIGSSPNKVVEAIQKEIEKNPTVIYEQKWIVIDRDEHHNFQETINRANNLRDKSSL